MPQVSARNRRGARVRGTGMGIAKPVRGGIRRGKQPGKKRKAAGGKRPKTRSTRPMTTCPSCGCPVKVESVDRHLRRVHGGSQIPARPLAVNANGRGTLWHAGDPETYTQDGRARTFCGFWGWVDHNLSDKPIAATVNDLDGQPVECLICQRAMLRQSTKG